MLKLSDKKYFALDAVNASSLKKFAEGGASFVHYLKNGVKQTDAMKIGTCLHSIVLENKKCWALFNKPRTTKAARAEYAKKIQHFGQVLSWDESLKVYAMKNSLLNHSVGKLICNKPNQAELTALATCEDTGLKLKAKFDFAPVKGNVLFDLKKVASLDKFKFAVRDFGYDIQAAHYLYVSELLGLPYKNFVFVCVEDKAPYRVECFKLSAENMEIAQNKYHLLLSDYAQCKQENNFASYNLNETIKEI